jgi:PAS domain S-box-containing protein
MLGYESVEALLAEDDHGNVLVRPDEGAQLIEMLEEKGFVVGFEHEVKTRDGSTRWLSNSARAIRDAEGNLVGIQGSVEDVTDRVVDARQRSKLEEQLRQAQKMEAVGQLAGGIAHDFNNILSVVINYATFIKDETDPDDPRYGDISEIADAGERGAKLVRQILAFSRKEVVEPEIVDLNRAVDGMQEMLKRTLSEDIALELALGKDLRPVNIDRTQIEQVLLNLAVNARDAMKQGGRLMIETSNETFDDLVAEQHPELAPGNYVSLSVSDTGTGMDEEVRNRVFEPFYTTKAVGEGTGLGLSMVYGVVQRAKGHVYVYSEPQVGTRFRIYLPVAEESAPVSKDGVSSGELPKAEGHTILLVEDEASVRNLTARILERYGYEVLQAGNGKQALEEWSKAHDRIDLLLTDVIMPGMSGKELAEALRDQGSDVRVLYMSGYTDAIVASRGMLRDGEVLVQKPFTATTLLHKVRDAIQASPQRTPTASSV